ncbi:hypothetical protein SAMN05192532_102371 [Alteribacillus iranensis]|uniref:Uncharacterized protein n=1 Tax=Alteribacillus iranensis TaxID=930128 RepID=A0A1I2BL15_9BACI|nr:hypothetical protein SAMN05192532_102371 [Alteribacillus iranensis]
MLEKLVYSLASLGVATLFRMPDITNSSENERKPCRSWELGERHDNLPTLTPCRLASVDQVTDHCKWRWV